jgi:predicted PurR-regulated permease PerM
VRLPYLASGPLVWLVTIGITTLLLVASAKALWLVVPSLLAIILYYLMFPVVHRLMLAGISREAAAGLVAAGVTLLAVGIMIPLVPWLASQSIAGEATFNRYLAGGRELIDRTLIALEQQFAFLRRMNFHAEVGKMATEFGENTLQKKIGEALLAAAMWLPFLLLVPFFAFFLLRDGGQFAKLLAGEVPNAFFERTIYMFNKVDETARNYFQGLLKLTVVDTVCLGLGLAIVGVPNALVLGLVAAVLQWVPVVGSAVGCLVVVLVAATESPGDPGMVYAVIGVFVLARLLDNFFFIPMTVGRSIRMHPMPTVLMVFIGGAVAGVPGLVLALPMAGVVSAVVGTIGGIVQDPHLRARHAFTKALQQTRVNADFKV